MVATAGLNRTASTPCGVLARGGEAMVRVYVYLDELPQHVPERWSDAVEPVRDSAGRLVDWRFRRPRQGAVHEAEEQRRQFRRWRSGHVADRLVGDLATVGAFLGWADRHCDVTLLHVLRLAEGQIAWKDAMRVAWQARRAGDACRSSGEQGLGVFADDGRRLVRGFVTGPGSVTVLADDQMALTAIAKGLVLEKQGPRGGRVPIRGWRRTGADVSVLTDEAVAPLTDRHAVRMLTALAPGVDEVRTAPVALSRLFAGIVVNVADLAETAASVHRPLISRIGPPL